jgi:hypothetical protein
MIEYLTSTFDTCPPEEDSLFDIRFFRVSFPIKLATTVANGDTDTQNLTPDT